VAGGTGADWNTAATRPGSLVLAHLGLDAAVHPGCPYDGGVVHGSSPRRRRLYHVSLWPVALDRRAELMDDPALPAAEHLAALDALATINAISLTGRQMTAAIRRIAGHLPTGRSLRVVDVACGGGDMTIAIATRLTRMLADREAAGGAAAIEVLGLDLSERAIARGRAAAARRGCRGVDFAARDVIAEGLPPCDIAVSSLFLHHLDDPRAADVLRRMAAARLGGVVSDLVRSRCGLVLAVLGTRLLTRSRVARIDGPLSVRAARTLAEYRVLTDHAGLPHATIRKTWPERVMLEWKTATVLDALLPGVACA
jgi:SAM-dependent methyltransferase